MFLTEKISRQDYQIRNLVSEKEIDRLIDIGELNVSKGTCLLWRNCLKERYLENALELEVLITSVIPQVIVTYGNSELTSKNIGQKGLTSLDDLVEDELAKVLLIDSSTEFAELIKYYLIEQRNENSTVDGVTERFQSAVKKKVTSNKIFYLLKEHLLSMHKLEVQISHVNAHKPPCETKINTSLKAAFCPKILKESFPENWVEKITPDAWGLSHLTNKDRASLNKLKSELLKKGLYTETTEILNSNLKVSILEETPAILKQNCKLRAQIERRLSMAPALIVQAEDLDIFLLSRLAPEIRYDDRSDKIIESLCNTPELCGNVRLGISSCKKLESVQPQNNDSINSNNSKLDTLVKSYLDSIPKSAEPELILSMDHLIDDLNRGENGVVFGKEEEDNDHAIKEAIWNYDYDFLSSNGIVIDDFHFASRLDPREKAAGYEHSSLVYLGPYGLISYSFHGSNQGQNWHLDGTCPNQEITTIKGKRKISMLVPTGSLNEKSAIKRETIIQSEGDSYAFKDGDAIPHKVEILETSIVRVDRPRNKTIKKVCESSIRLVDPNRSFGGMTMRRSQEGMHRLVNACDDNNKLVVTSLNIGLPDSREKLEPVENLFKTLITISDVVVLQEVPLWAFEELEGSYPELSAAYCDSRDSGIGLATFSKLQIKSSSQLTLEKTLKVYHPSISGNDDIPLCLTCGRKGICDCNTDFNLPPDSQRLCVQKVVLKSSVRNTTHVLFNVHLKNGRDYANKNDEILDHCNRKSKKDQCIFIGDFNCNDQLSSTLPLKNGNRVTATAYIEAELVHITTLERVSDHQPASLIVNLNRS